MKECLVGGKFGKPALEQAVWPAAGRTTAYPLGRIRCDAGEEEDGALVERIEALLARPDASTLPPWEVLGVARNARAPFRELSRLLHPDKRSWLGRKISGEKLVSGRALRDGPSHRRADCVDGGRPAPRRDVVPRDRVGSDGD